MTRLIPIVLVLVAIAGDARADFVVIRNAKNRTASVSRAELKQLFNGKTKAWTNGSNVVLVIGSEESPAMKWLAQAVFSVSAKTYLAKIKQDVFRGDVIHPLEADDDAKTLRRVLSGEGVVGIVSDAAARSLPAGVVVLPVE